MFVGVTWLRTCFVYLNAYDSALPGVMWNKTVPSLWEYNTLEYLKMYHNICINFSDVTVTIRENINSENEYNDILHLSKIKAVCEWAISFMYEAINSFITDFLRL